MSLPPYPNPVNPSFNAPQLGLYPLRPLRIGEIFGAAMRITWRHLAVLAPLAFLFTAASAGVELALLAGNGALPRLANGELSTFDSKATPAELSAQLRDFYSHVAPALGLSALVSLIGAWVLAAVATPFAALGATTATAPQAAGLARLRGRYGVVLLIGVVCGLAIGIGTLVLIVPGVMLWLILLPAGPVAAMERSSLRETLSRAAALTRGVKGRLFGIGTLMTLITGAIGLGVSSILGELVHSDDAVTGYVITVVIGAVIGAFTTAWSSSVIAMLYIDIRIRREGLAQALLASSQPSSLS